MSGLSSTAELAATLARAGAFDGFAPEVVATVISLGRERTFPRAAAVMRQGEASTSVHVILAGRARVLLRHSDGKTLVLAELGPGQAVGEMGVLENTPRSATVVATEELKTIELGVDAFRQLARKHPQIYAVLSRMLSRRLRKTNELVSATMDQRTLPRPLSTTPLESIDPRALNALLSHGRPKSFMPGKVVYRQGEPSLWLLFVVSGRVRVERTVPDLTVPVTLAELGPGEFVGEMGIVDGAPRAATVTAIETTEAIEVDYEAALSTLARFPELSKELAQVLSRRLRRTNELAQKDAEPDG